MNLQITGIVFFANDFDKLAGLVPNCILFAVELVWERAGVKGVQEESVIYLGVFWLLSIFLPAFIIVVVAVSGEQLWGIGSGDCEFATFDSNPFAELCDSRSLRPCIYLTVNSPQCCYNCVI